MKRKTKRHLNIIFGLGLVTASLSIARAATLTRKALTEDKTCRVIPHTLVYVPLIDSRTGNIMPSMLVNTFECHLGLILACAPALRQFWAYRTRTHTFLPSKHRQYPNEDFEKMRRRINLRDIFWYRKAHEVSDKLDAAPTFKSSPPPEASSSDPQSSTKVSSSILDVWETKLKSAFTRSHHDKTACRHSSRSGKSTFTMVAGKPNPHGDVRPGDLPSEQPHATRRWSLFSRKPAITLGKPPRETFLLSDSGAGTSAATTKEDEHDDDLNDNLYHAKIKPTSGSQIV
ncbi:MAG: hypothetical protein Q9209_000140 [Squamulea sp. 1 TL-2023]